MEFLEPGFVGFGVFVEVQVFPFVDAGVAGWVGGWGGIVSREYFGGIVLREYFGGNEDRIGGSKRDEEGKRRDCE